MKIRLAILIFVLAPLWLSAQTQVTGPTIIQGGTAGPQGPMGPAGPNCQVSSPPGSCNINGNLTATNGTFPAASVNSVLNETLFPGATAAIRIGNACAAAATPLTPVIVPPSETDTSMVTPSKNCQIIDYRGTSIPTYYGSFNSGNTAGFTNGVLTESFETRTSNPSLYQGFANDWHYYAALKGGTYFYPLGPTGGGNGAKTDYFNIAVMSTFNTIAQKTGIISQSWSTANGETMGIQSYITEGGGYQGPGAEPTEALRIQMQQMGTTGTSTTGGLVTGAIAAITGTGPYTVNFNATSNLTGLGEHCCIRDLGRLYNTGTFVSATANSNTPIAGVTSVSIAGSGTTWTTLGVGSHSTYNTTANSSGFILTATNLCFTISGAQNDGFDVVLPIDSIVDDTHLNVIPQGVGTSQNTGWFAGWPTSGSYQINGCAFPSSTSQNSVANTGTFTTSDVSGLTSGHSIDQSIAYNLDMAGIQLVQTRHIGRAGYGGGVNILNNSSANAPQFSYGMAVSGNYACALCVQTSNQPVAPYDTVATFSRPNGSSVNYANFEDLSQASTGKWSFWNARMSDGVLRTMIQADPNTASATYGLTFPTGNVAISTGALAVGETTVPGAHPFQVLNADTASAFEVGKTGYGVGVGAASSNHVRFNIQTLSGDGVGFYFVEGANMSSQAPFVEYYGYNSGSALRYYNWQDNGSGQLINEHRANGVISTWYSDAEATTTASVNGSTGAIIGTSVKSTATTFSGLGTCNAGAEGTRRGVTDSTTATYGATIAGSGTNHVPAYCNGTNWVVD